MTDRSPDSYAADVLRLVQQLAPRSVLAIGEEAARLFARYADGDPGRRVVAVSAERALGALQDDTRYDFAYLAQTLENLPKQEGARLLARLRDVSARRLIVVVPAEQEPGQLSAWDQADLLALGLRRLGSYGTNGGRAQVYTFDLYDYKTTPDWFNNANWAHPELWDKYWW